MQRLKTERTRGEEERKIERGKKRKEEEKQRGKKNDRGGGEEERAAYHEGRKEQGVERNDQAATQGAIKEHVDVVAASQ